MQFCRDVLFEFHLKFLNTTSIGIPVRSLLLEVYYIDRLLTGLTAQEKGTTARLYSNKNISTHEISKNGKILYLKKH